MPILSSNETARFGVFLGSIIALIVALNLAYFVDFDNQNFKWTIIIAGTVQSFLTVFLITLSMRRRISFKSPCPSKMLLDLRNIINLDDNVKRVSGTTVSKTWQIEEYSDDEDDHDDEAPSEKGLNFIGTFYSNA